MNRSLLLALSSIALASGAVQAKEGPDQYPNGAENWFAGAAPPPGNYFINYFGHYSGKLKDGDGDDLVVGGDTPTVNATFDALRFLQVTDKTLFGANWAWHVIVPVVHQRLDIAPLGGEEEVLGLGDITINPLILAWHPSSQWHYVAALDIHLPTGKYDENDPRKSIGANYYSFEPVFALSYLGSDGWEVSTKFMYNIKMENTETDYQSGNEFHMDYLVGKNLGNWGVGISGYYLKQTTDDEQNGVKVGDGNRGQVLAYGPSVKYKNASGVNYIAQWQHETQLENRFGGNKVWLKLILPL